MTEPKLNSAKAVVSDLVSRGAKFGNFKTSKKNLKKKYISMDVFKFLNNQKVDKDVLKSDVIDVYLNKKTGKPVAYTISSSTTYKDGYKCSYNGIIDRSTPCELEYFTNSIDDNRFRTIAFGLEGTTYHIIDTKQNGIFNGVIDKNDKIEIIYRDGRKVEKTISEFLEQ